MLGLLLMAGLGFAATAIMEHVDVHASDEPHSDEDEAQAETTHGSLLDDHDPSVEDHADPHMHHATQGNAPETDAHPAEEHGAADDHSAVQHTVVTKSPDTQAVQDHADRAGDSAAAPLGKVFGSEDNDTLHGSDHNDLMEGNGGDDLLQGKMGRDHLIAFDEGKDTLFGNRGDDTLHGYLVQHQPDDTSFAIEDHQADHLHGGLGNDTLMLGSDDVGSGGQGADEFHVSWDVEHGHPAQITDYNPKQDKLFVEFTSNHADADLTAFKPEDANLTTMPMEDGAGTAILLNGQPIAHVLGATNLKAADIGLIHA